MPGRLITARIKRRTYQDPETETGLEALLRFTGQALSGVVTVLLVAYLGFRAHVNFSTAGFLHVLIVVLIAMIFGFWPATITSFAALICLNYFFVAPVYSFRVDDPQNWVALIAFESTALIVSRLSTQLETQARTAIQGRRSMERLYELSRSVLLLNRQQPPGPQIVLQIQQTMEVEGVALFEATLAQVDVAGSNISELRALARQTYLQDADRYDTESRTWQRVLRLGPSAIGAIALRGIHLSPIIVNAVASLTAIALERARSFEKESRAEAARQSEQLRTTVLDALAHAFKTPLTAIRTASSGLLEAGGLSAAQEDLSSLIDEESAKLNELTTRLLQTAKLEAAETRLRLEDVGLYELVDQVLTEHSEQLDGHAVQISIGNPHLATRGDRELLAAAVTQYIDNAAKYSTPGSPIAISVEESDDGILISVHNEGPLVRPEDRERIFERFYRSPGSSHRAAGTGLGLSITKKAAEAHRGRAWVQSEEGKGTTFFLSLPLRDGSSS
jgi:two-component system sensor histidine kinase KdpD